MLARRLRDTNGALAATSFLSLKGRVARALLILAAAFGQDVGGGRILVRQKLKQNARAVRSSGGDSQKASKVTRLTKLNLESRSA